MVFDKIQSLCPYHFCCHSRKLHKEPFLLSHSHIATSVLLTICLGTNMADSIRRQDKTFNTYGINSLLFLVSCVIRKLVRSSSRELGKRLCGLAVGWAEVIGQTVSLLLVVTKTKT